MMSLYLRALTKRANTIELTQFKSPRLPQRIYTRQFRFDPSHYQRYCRVTGWTREQELHPCYLQVATLPQQLTCLLDKKSPFAPVGLVHIENDITLLGDFDRAQPAEVRVRYLDVKPHALGWLVMVEVVVLQNEKAVYCAQSGYLNRVRAAHVAPRQKKSVADRRPLPDGQALAEIVADTGAGRRYAAVSGDYNPIHLFGVTARLFGFKQAIAHGMWTLARTLGVRLCAGDSEHEPLPKIIHCQFKRPLFLPGHATVMQADSDAGEHLVVMSGNTVYLDVTTR
ncbi:MaoC family dehydratase [Alteromonas sp. CYL-A6]|uniref:MaoC family dehydratase n=1 Tax=Alteromonas nitratireducens TaxID=3390813 RepID=UPI0034B9A832